MPHPSELAWTPYTVKPLQINAEKYQGAVEMVLLQELPVI
jgi:hypothetical protein